MYSAGGSYYILLLRGALFGGFGILTYIYYRLKNVDTNDIC